MKISELIECLNRLQDEYGDLRVTVDGRVYLKEDNPYISSRLININKVEVTGALYCKQYENVVSLS